VLLKCLVHKLRPVIWPTLKENIWTCQFNLLHTAITFHHFFTVSLWARNLPFQKILSSTLVCRTDLMAFTGFLCSSVFTFLFLFLSEFSYSSQEAD